MSRFLTDSRDLQSDATMPKGIMGAGINHCLIEAWSRPTFFYLDESMTAPTKQRFWWDSNRNSVA